MSEKQAKFFKFKRLNQLINWRKLIEQSGLNRLSGAAADYALPLEAWQATGNVLTSILVASLMINLLSLAFPLALLQIYDRIIPNVAINTLVLLAIGVATAVTLEALLRVTRSYVGAWADSKFEHITGLETFKRLVGSSLKEYESEGSGIHLKRVNSLSMLRDFYAGQAIISLADIPFVVILLALIAYIAGWLVLVPFIMVIVFLVITVLFAEKLQALLVYRQEHDDRRFNFIIETLNNIHTVKSVTMEAQMLRRYERLQRAGSVNDHDVSYLGSRSMSVGFTLSQLTIVLVVAFGSMLVIKGNLTIGGLAACTLLSGRCLQPVNSLVAVWTRLQSIRISREELNTVLAMQPESAEGLPDIGEIKGSVEYKNVSFRYTNDEHDIFQNLNISIRANQAIGITGSGLSGKSTFMWLLLGMQRPTEGEILIDNKNIVDYDINSVRKQIGYLPQHGVLFNGTIMENLTMFQDARALLQAARDVVDEVGLTDIIAHLPQGFDTPVADQAIESLPKGIKQRIAIARALITKPPIVLFDEANTAIDMQGDAIIKAMLTRMVGECTLIIISHRPSILEIAEQTYLLEGKQLRLLI